MGIKGEEIVDHESFIKDYEIYGDYIPVQKPVDVQGDMEVLISEIKTPFRFYMQLKKCQPKLAKVFDSMQRFYGRANEIEERLKIPPEYIIHNQICAAVFPDDQVFNSFLRVKTPLICRIHQSWGNIIQ